MARASSKSSRTNSASFDLSSGHFTHTERPPALPGPPLASRQSTGPNSPRPNLPGSKALKYTNRPVTLAASVSTCRVRNTRSLSRTTPLRGSTSAVARYRATTTVCNNAPAARSAKALTTTTSRRSTPAIPFDCPREMDDLPISHAPYPNKPAATTPMMQLCHRRTVQRHTPSSSRWIGRCDTDPGVGQTGRKRPCLTPSPPPHATPRSAPATRCPARARSSRTVRRPPRR